MKLLAKLLPLVIPFAVRWAQAGEKRILRDGLPLSDEQIVTARRMGVASPEKIRLLKVASIPPPENPILLWAAKVSGLFSPYTSGMSLRYGILIRKEYWMDPCLIAHECAHTAQYERLGGFRGFLKAYLRECLEVGYPDGPLEQEAITKAGELRG